MVRKSMYQKIQHLKKQGLNKSEIASRLKMDRKTVGKYFSMTEEDYRQYLIHHIFRGKTLDAYRKEIVEVYSKNNFTRLNMSAVYDYLVEVHGELPCTEKSLRNYISFLIEIGTLEIKENVRMYSSVPELPFGKQMQLDFGQYITRSELKIYIFAVVLSSSRFKFAAFQDTPFTTACVIQHLLDCFEYFRGVPEELVIDQDSLLVVSENKGDVIYTNKFNHFIQEMELKMYVCRKADPESKGKIENFIKYIKRNFLAIRDFANIQEANSSLQKWLKRRANGNISRATKQIPTNLFEEEQKYLRSIPKSIFRKDMLFDREVRVVNDKSFISVNSCQYSVPVKYRNRSVEIYLTPVYLFVFDVLSGKEIANHEVSSIPGAKITNRTHFREKETTSTDLREQILHIFDMDEWITFVRTNFKTFPRYVRDQCLEAKRYFKKEIDRAKLKKALVLCIENKTWSFKNLQDTYQFYLQAESLSKPVFSEKKIDRHTPDLEVTTRSLAKYSNLLSTEAGS